MGEAIGFIGNNIQMIYILILAIFIGQEVISNIPTVLHTPLMSGSNAISGIVVLGAIVAVLRAESNDYLTLVIGTTAIIFATMNVVGGFMVTDRILGMFKKKK